jgi:hypothetical protein
MRHCHWNLDALRQLVTPSPLALALRALVTGHCHWGGGGRPGAPAEIRSHALVQYMLNRTRPGQTKLSVNADISPLDEDVCDCVSVHGPLPLASPAEPPAAANETFSSC